MDKLQIFDFHRIFIGDFPMLFLMEIVFRTGVMYIYTILLLRFLGKRSMGQLSTLEVAIIICFGSAVGDPMMGADVPLLHGMVVITTVGLLQTGMERLINRHRKMETLMEGKPDCLVNDGLVVYENLKVNNLSQEDLFRSLRSNQVDHLGEVKMALFETSGYISVSFHAPKNIKPGLPVVPRELLDPNSLFDGADRVPDARKYSCTNCGYTKGFSSSEYFGSCLSCSCTCWVKAGLSE
ncbi:DUF421 domain-containing protein [Pedobacter metabolipauper]|uniref:Uncharacterized membrane protein YcaP (DUF421 family) n=1 Tax=Pedobacter metabolipauper TaxID=425513 RepID=A0A4R6SP15_9SPHI|nr:YetF domain-containing protein [Pedobacter metabolipauper]TDQ06321.1 uncharacterized membrane protein YcaP (DUF421 family) [Pedobacter metabolipauper]